MAVESAGVLSIGKLAAGQQDYYLRSVGAGVEDYYLGSGESPGRWIGAGAARLGLSGQVNAEDLAHILDGVHPSTRQQLWPARSPRRLPGWDMTFSAPKSVSLLYALGTPAIRETVVAGHEVALARVSGYLEREAGFVRRGHGGTQLEAGAGLVGAAFRHRSSRTTDPQLHTHVLMANLVATQDGGWRAVWSRAFYRHARTASSLYRATLRDELSRQFGVTWRPRRHGMHEIAGIPPAVLRAFSRRRTDIEAELERRGTSSPKAAGIATLTTRQTKTDPVTDQDLYAQWRTRADEIGFTPQQLREVLGTTGRELWDNAPGNLAQPLARDLGPLARGLAQAEIEASQIDELTTRRLLHELLGPDGLTAQASVFRRRDAVREISDRLPSGAPAQAIQQLAEQLLHSPEIVTLTGPDDPVASVSRFDERLVFTTRDLLRLEQRVVTLAEHGRRTGRGLVEPGLLAGVVHAAPALATEQRLMINKLCRSGNLIDTVVGVPGAGKTRSLAVAHEAWRAAGHPVVGCSVKATAAAELQTGAGIPSFTVARLLLDLDRLDPRTGQPAGLPQGAILVLDEAGMLGTRHLARILAHVQNAQGKLVLVGDPKQLPSIDAAGLYPLLARRPDAITLASNHRQTEAADRDALAAYRRNDITAVLSSYASRGRLHLHNDADAQRQAIVDGWWKDQQAGLPAVMLAYRRIDIAALNQLARTRMLTSGRLSGPRLTVSSEELGERTFQTGDHVVLRRNNTQLNVRNGDRGTVTSIDSTRGTITIHLDREHATVELPLQYSGQGGLDHGYALTLHASQGLTINRTHILANDALFYEAGLVALSRHRDTCHLHVAGSLDLADDREISHVRPKERRHNEGGDEQLSVLAVALRNSRADKAALDHTAPQFQPRRPTDDRTGR
jgi:conjugative relaxase-like TrwC/TraI family protein